MKLQDYRNAVEHIMCNLAQLLGALDADIATQQKKIPTPLVVM